MKMKMQKKKVRQGRIDKREEILMVATEYFLTHGYDGTKINCIARESGISKESIYRYFHSKIELFEAVIDKELEDYQARLESIAHDSDGTLQEQLIRIAEILLGVVTTDRNLAFRRLIFEQARQSPDIGQHYFKIGPTQSYRHVESLLLAHNKGSNFSTVNLSHYFVALVLHYPVMTRECAVSKALTPGRIRKIAARVADDFMLAFLRN